MHRTMLYLEEDAWRALQDEARRQGRSAASLVREAVRRVMTPPQRPRRLSFVGTVNGPRRDIGRRADAILRARWK